ncbi:hypothetical protein KBB76_02235 [Candidatus Saccharibacteria bacterium]|jgi:hypothetical protein|nr:hypothetical protein [Candidatus Saccharibacteria bacterium]HOR23257.1 hypothetical protein [Candidatus Saccharibacteria bacterium]
MVRRPPRRLKRGSKKKTDIRSKPKKSVKRKLTNKTAKRKLDIKLVSKGIYKIEVAILIIGGLSLLIIWMIVKTTSVMNQLNWQTLKSADSLLTYDAVDINQAKAIGPVGRLKKEIIGYDKAASDLQLYILNDYKQYKKSCMANGYLVDKIAYELVEFTYNQFALISMDCGGKEYKILKKIDDQWKVIYSSSMTIPCSLVNDFGVPQAISYQCLNNGTLYVNPNP